jgi:uncharacterized damage-inducible protein DinB
MANRALMRKMTRYTAWADDVMLSNAAALPPEELGRKRHTLFGSIIGTFDHVLLICDVFRTHLEGRAHGHRSRARDLDRPFDTVAAELRAANSHYVTLADTWSTDAFEDVIRFSFIGGGQGAMTRSDILLHLANHATYHRGFVSTLLYPFRPDGAANDFTVFLRDAWPALVRQDPTLAP